MICIQHVFIVFACLHLYLWQISIFIYLYINTFDEIIPKISIQYVKYQIIHHFNFEYVYHHVHTNIKYGISTSFIPFRTVSYKFKVSQVPETTKEKKTNKSNFLENVFDIKILSSTKILLLMNWTFILLKEKSSFLRDILRSKNQFLKVNNVCRWPVYSSCAPPTNLPNWKHNPTLCSLYLVTADYLLTIYWLSTDYLRSGFVPG